MAAQKTVSKLYQKLGKRLDKAVEANRDNEVDYGRGPDLPGGIANGIAQLTKCYFKEYGADTKQMMSDGKTSAAGEFFFRAEGVIQEPTTNDKGTPVKGLTTSITIPVIATKYMGEEKTQEDMVAIIINEMKKLDEGIADGMTGAELEAVASVLETAKPYFRFASVWAKEKTDPKTGQPYPPRAYQNWYGSKGLDYTPPDHASEAVSDRSGSTQAASQPNNPAELPDEPEEAVESPEEATETSDVEVLTGLAEQADLQDESDECEEAQKELEKIAIGLGISKKKVKGADNWAEVVEMIQQAKAEVEAEAAAAESDVDEQPEETTEETSDDDDKYEAGKTFKYIPAVKNVKTGKLEKGKKAIDVEIVDSNSDKQTSTILSLIDSKTKWKNVKWSDLIED